MTDRCLLLAGSLGPERVPARPDPDHVDWFMPLHVRTERAARERLAAQVALGVDVIVAPTWLTHRRALMPLGETRRARAWTAAAVRVARAAVQLGLEHREERQAALDTADPTRRRPTPLIAATLPALDDEPDVASGRLLPTEAATERDYRDQAGLVADAEPDLVLVEGQRTLEDARIASREAIDTGLPVWSALTVSAFASTGLEEWLDWARAAGISRLLLPPPPDERLRSADGDVLWGGLVRDPGAVPAWLAAGASAIGLLDGAAIPALESMRSAVDDHERAAVEAESADRQRWQGMVEEAARMAPGGAAVWLGQPPAHGLPGGFDWLVLDEAEVPGLPQGRFGLVVATHASDPRLERILERGGLLVGPLPHPGGLRYITIDEVGPPLAISRREA